MLAFFLLYIFLCFIVGAAGKKQPLGFVGYFLISVFLTPSVGLIILLVMMLYTRAAAKKPTE
ncbi:MAG: hypothetical protein ACI8WB_005568 [Phenylobacterium sp.]|jgi:hypothetical protein